jgi:hypothetical protein
MPAMPRRVTLGSAVMRTRAQEFLRKPGPIGPDGALALSLTILLQAELWLGEHYQGHHAFPGSKAGTAPFLLLATLAFAWRRRYPTATLATVLGALAVQSLATGGTEAGGGFLAVLIAVYSAAAYGDRPLATAAIAAGIGAQYVPQDAFGRLMARFSRLSPALQGATLAVALMVSSALGPEGVAPFIYFRF